MVNPHILIQALGKRITEEISIRQLSIDAKIPYSTSLRFINEHKDLFKINRKGNMNLISLNLEDNITKSHLIIAERQVSDAFIKKNPEFKILTRELPKKNYCLILFGSRAEDKNRKKSDVDFCIISVDKLIKIHFSTFEMLTKLEVNPIFFTKQEFKLMMQDKEHNLADEIQRKHVILYGEDFFWNLVWKHVI